ncbi:MAG: phosphotyrosine protein phosphatase [Phycisphaerae bacterium]|nr:phosphotyrosine protein phosphatase [Phycisphaerae bacterium]
MAKTSVLFVCMGNICRSPAAESFFRKEVELAGLSTSFDIDSAGTGGWHKGAPPDSRMQEAAEKQGLYISGSARQVCKADFDHFDWIFCMDDDNYANLMSMGANPKSTFKLLPFTGHDSIEDVPDPYYGGEEGFNFVVRLIHEASKKLLNKLT